MKQAAAQRSTDPSPATDEEFEDAADPVRADARSLSLYEHEFEQERPQEASAKVGEMLYFSPRFWGDELLADIHLGAATLKEGDTGLAVSRVQAALSDLGYTTEIDGDFGEGTAASVREFRGDDVAVVEQFVMFNLDSEFQDHSADAAVASSMTTKKKPKPNKEFKHGKAPKELLAGTHTLNKYEKKAASELLEPVSEIDPNTGVKREFKEDVGSGTYVDRLRDIVNAEVDAQFTDYADGKADLHDDPANLHDVKSIAAIGTPAKDVTDAVFGSYATGKAFTTDNVKDRWAEQETRIAGLEEKSAKGGKKGKAAAAELMDIAIWRVQKIINENELVRDLNDEHGAVVDKDPASGHVDSIIKEVAKARQSELLEIHKGWGGSANPDTRTIYLQMFKGADVAEDRLYMWRQFQTMIHEYIHTLNHSRYRKYTETLDDAKSHALREGMTDYLTKLVWSTVNGADPALRAQVLGTFNSTADTTPPPPLDTYSESIEAEQVVGLVGAQNAFAAYFLGEVELIGGK